MRGYKRCCIASVVGLAALAAIAMDEPADGSSDEEGAARGGHLYSIYCANCHGSSAEGDGPTAEYLTVKPTDLTELSRSNRGEFPADEVRQAIDGRTRARGHGSGRMPIWGLSFQEPNQDSNQEDGVQRKVAQIVLYLETIQKD